MISRQDIDQLIKRNEALKLERSTWLAHWKDISANVLPANGRFFLTDRNKGWKRNTQIYDSTGTRALRVMAAGMMAGMTSPSRPWFRLTLQDKDLMKYNPVAIWLDDVTEKISDILLKSNAYRALHGMYEELGAFGTNISFMADDFEKIIHLHPLTIGEYAIACNWKGEIDTLYREFDKQVGAIVGEFGYNNCSGVVKNLYDRGTLDAWITLIHAIEPRTERDLTKRDNLNMPYRSVYLEKGSHNGKVLRESGFNSFPCLSPRWSAIGGDLYGTSPAMDALGDIKQLQAQQYRKLQAIDFQVMPPLQVPLSMRSREIEIFPGGISYYDDNSPSAGVKPLFEGRLDLSALREDMALAQQRIKSTFYNDVFMMITDQDQRMTATEVTARNAEKMLMLGPVVERLNNEMLSPLIDTLFTRLSQAMMLPTPPPELQGQELHAEYISILAQAQQSMETNSIDRFTSALGQIAQLKPEILDKLNPDGWADEYAENLGISPEIINDAGQVALIRQQRMQAQQHAQQQQAMLMGSQVAKNLGQTSTADDTAAGAIYNRMQGKPQ
jgi:hypothetical protein